MENQAGSESHHRAEMKGEDTNRGQAQGWLLFPGESTEGD